MRCLGIDYGKKRVGVAISDETGKVAFPHATLLNNNGLMETVERLCKERAVSKIVIGESRDFAGKFNLIAKDIETFKNELSARVRLPVHYEPEFWTSVQAKRWQGKTDKLDASAAAIILQSYLDRKS
ncbi:MAG: hypothetical protein UW34_C0001G0003 [Parcubacteria group bacterium GW2011_GWA2_44_15]|nr:MAG: hypothetical protein UW34_C0001G0003 [Parcubacteria group bacterium GW2011_GWA2_44_15]